MVIAFGPVSLAVEGGACSQRFEKVDVDARLAFVSQQPRQGLVEAIHSGSSKVHSANKPAS